MAQQNTSAQPDAGSVQSQITIFFKDRLGVPIQNLKVEIRGLEEEAKRVYHAGVTAADGSVKFAAELNTALSAHVKRWTDDTMKEVARAIASFPTTRISLKSPKLLRDLMTAIDGGGQEGDYWRGTYVVKRGDTLTKIAKKYGTSISQLMNVNNLDNENVITAGQKLKVPPVKERKSDSPTQRKPPAKDSSLPQQQKKNENGSPANHQPHAHAIIFPVTVRPRNEAGGDFAEYNWKKELVKHDPAVAALYKAPRDAHRKHAARDLYLQDGTPIVAIAPGKVLQISHFYYDTWAISIHHTTSDGRQFVVRYGEVNKDHGDNNTSPIKIRVKVGQEVNQGEIIGYSGILRYETRTVDRKGKVHHPGDKISVVRGQNVSMLHFEYYKGTLGMDNLEGAAALTQRSLPPGHEGRDLQRRDDITDPKSILLEGYSATFGDQKAIEPAGDRIPIDQLTTSHDGKEFVKTWEGVHLDSTGQNTYYYDDKNGYCTVGWGHLVGGKRSCASHGFTGWKKHGDNSSASKMSIIESQAIFDADVKKHEQYVRDAIHVPLHQYEFDALVSLAFNVGHIGTVAPKLCKKINNKQYDDAPSELLDMANHSRRVSEYNLFRSEIYNASH